MTIDSSILYMPCPCGSGSKFKFCCWPKYRMQLDTDMTKAEIVQTVRCKNAGSYDRDEDSEAVQLCDRAHDLLVDEHDAVEAGTLFRRAREIDPHDPGAWNNGAVCSWELGNVEEACEIQRQGIENATYRNTFGMAAMATFLHVLGRDEEAADWIRRALEDKLPLSRDVVVHVCKALALFRRHREILDYAAASGMDGDENVAFFKATALANLGKTGEALPIFNSIGNIAYGAAAKHYADCIEQGISPTSAYPGDWPYFEPKLFPPARWFDKAMSEGRDPFARYPNVAVDAMEVLVSDGSRSPSELLKLLEGRSGERIAQLREGLEKLESNRFEGKWTMDEDKGKPFRLPPGVMDIKDVSATGMLVGKPKWRLEFTLSDECNADSDAERVLTGLVRPYYERYCSFGSFDTTPETEIALVQAYQHEDDSPLDTSPSVLFGQYRHLWNMLKMKLVDLFSDCFSSNYCVCEVRYDHMYGGPILTISEDSSSSIFTVAIADRFGRRNR